jgi:transposase
MAKPLSLLLRTPFGSWQTSDAEWERIQPLLPQPERNPSVGGRPRVQDRKILDAILFVLRTGCRWNALNALGICSSSTAHARFKEWSAAGVFGRLSEAGLLNLERPSGRGLSGMLWQTPPSLDQPGPRAAPPL